MSEVEKQRSQENLDKDTHCYLAWKMDWKFREILSKKTPNYLQHLKTLPSHDATDSIYQRTKWSHCSMHPPQIHNFFKKLKGVAENPDCKSDGISDTDSIRTEDFESRFTELLVPAPSIGSESQETIVADVGDGAEIDDYNDITITKEELLKSMSIEKPPAASIEHSDLHKWLPPDSAKQRYESKLMIPKKQEAKSLALKDMDIPNNETKEIGSNNTSSSCNIEMSTKLDDCLDKFRELPDCPQSKLWCLVNEMPTYPGADNNKTYQENALKQKVEQLIAENIKLSAEKALLIDELKEMKDKGEHRATFKLHKLQNECNSLRRENQTLSNNSTELECKLNDQSEAVSELTQQNNQYRDQAVQLENNKQLLTDNMSTLNMQLEHNAMKITGLQDQIKDLKNQLCLEKELCETQAQKHSESMAIVKKQSKDSLNQLENDHKHDLEKLKNANNAARDVLIEKYELRLARQVSAQTSQNAIKESQISSLKSKLIKLEFEQDCERQKWKQILVKNDDASKKKKQGLQPTNTEELMEQPPNNNFVRELHQKLESANKQILNLNTNNQQLCLRVGHLREELTRLMEVNKSREEERSWDISETRDILTQHNQLMIQDLKDKITKEMHVEVLSLMQRLHQQEDELVYIKSMWNKMLKSLHLFECEGNNSTVFGMDKLEILIAGLLNEESHLNMNILGVKYLSRLTKSVCGKTETGKYQTPATDIPTLAQYLQEPIKTAYNRLHSTSQQLRDLVKSLSKHDSHNPSFGLYPAPQADSIHYEFPVETVNREKNMFRPFHGITSTSSAECSANDEESQRMIMLECDLNHQAKVLLELMRSYNGLQEALVASHSSIHPQKGICRNSTAE